MNIGSSNRQIYDTCSYEKRLYESTSPLAYMLYGGYAENCNKCTSGGFYVKYQPEIVDIESELLNLTRPLSNCDQFKYNPKCGKSGLCTSTFHKSVPIVPGVDACPIIQSNIPKRTHPGYHLEDPNICLNRWRRHRK